LKHEISNGDEYEQKQRPAEVEKEQLKEAERKYKSSEYRTKK
tara:strand:- start:203 stop:328 length:126 start_codon:yes stop_codon:yes gene_type:complete